MNTNASNNDQSSVKISVKTSVKPSIKTSTKPPVRQAMPCAAMVF
jgi:hypothetical protein